MLATGLVAYDPTHNFQSYGRDVYEVDSARMKPNALEMFESVVRPEITGIKTKSHRRCAETIITVKGKIDASAFDRIHEYFDEGQRMNDGVTGEVCGGDIAVGYAHGPQIRHRWITVSHATPESVQRLLLTGIPIEGIEYQTDANLRNGIYTLVKPQ
jgi:hypothetical protein